MTKPVVSVGLVTWNSACFLPGCLRGLAAQDYPNIEVIVVDNASADDSLKAVQSGCSSAIVISNPENAGFCRAHNQAIAASSGAYYMALNPDVEMQPSFISHLVDTLEANATAGTALGRLSLPAEPDGMQRLDSTGLFIDRRRRQWIRGHGEIDRGQYGEPGEVFGADGAAPLYRRAMLEDIKIDGQYFDEAFFAHKEDVDLAWRARLFGWSCRYAPAAVATHHRTFRPGHRAAISDEVKLHAVKNRYFLLIKNESPAGWRRDLLPILWYDLKILLYILFLERSSLPALGLVRRNWGRLLSWRKEIHRRSREPAAEILKWFQ